MKFLNNPQSFVSADGKTVTITAEIKDMPFNGILTSRVTHGHINPNNTKHPRHIQSSNVAVFVRSQHGCVAFNNDFLASIAAEIEPMTSFAPVLDAKKSQLGNLVVISELPVKYQWQVSDNANPKGKYPPPAAVWTDIAGETLSILDESKVKVGQWVRCIATNNVGSVISPPTQRK